MDLCQVSKLDIDVTTIAIRSMVEIGYKGIEADKLELQWEVVHQVLTITVVVVEIVVVVLLVALQEDLDNEM